jgi:excisionase family DNA binding protein
MAITRSEIRRARPGQNQAAPRPGTALVSTGAERLVYSVPEAGRLLGLSRNAAYAAAKRGDISTIRIGRRLVVPKAAFHRTFEFMRSGDGEKVARS